MPMLRDTLAARLAAMGSTPDYARLAAEVLGIRGAREDLARRLVLQALTIEDRRDVWRQIGQKVCREAPASAGVYVFRDMHGQALYVGKAVNLRRRLRAHFADRQWRALKPAMARGVAVQWREVGSEIEALLREAMLIEELRPAVNVQMAPPRQSKRRVRPALIRDVVVVVPSIEAESVELVSARTDGRSLLLRAGRNGVDLTVEAGRLWQFFNATDATDPAADERPLAPLIFSWLAARGADATRLDPHEALSSRDLRAWLETLLSDKDLFTERIALKPTRPVT